MQAKAIQADWSSFQGVSLRVKGDGQTFKVNLKTSDQVDRPERTYQATFDTVEGGPHSQESRGSGVGSGFRVLGLAALPGMHLPGHLCHS